MRASSAARAACSARACSSARSAAASAVVEAALELGSVALVARDPLRRAAQVLERVLEVAA